ncbi:putative ATP-binding component of ABC transporter [Pseudomonas aeruginosa]|nr:putative ATP-binding component of ABC transporter [Pseudomonas aeruginosa]
MPSPEACSAACAPALPADLQARLRQAPGGGDPVLLDLQYTGASRRVPDLLAIARAIGQRVDLLHGGIERIQGRALGRLLLQVGAPPGELPGVLAKAALVADKVEVLGHVAHA